jgi:hypothetical protein
MLKEDVDNHDLKEELVKDDELVGLMAKCVVA